MAFRVGAFVALLGMTLVSLSAGGTADAARLAQSVNWGSPDQPYGKRRPVTDADRGAFKAIAPGASCPSSRRVLPIPLSSKLIGD